MVIVKSLILRWSPQTLKQWQESETGMECLACYSSDRGKTSKRERNSISVERIESWVDSTCPRTKLVTITSYAYILNMATNSSTSAGIILSSTHGRMRRAQRVIEKRDLHAAVKYGDCEVSYNQRGVRRLKYTFADIVYITDAETSTNEITCWAAPGAGVDVEKYTISSSMRLNHLKACRRNATNFAAWTSHTVIVVDQSGSMRKPDVEGGTTRSDAVWLTIAMDFISKQLMERQSSDTDVVSIVAMGKSGTIVVDKKPHDWILFNTVIDLLRNQEPCFVGNYGPSLDTAETLLLENRCGSCALTLLFLSDGRPSDELARGFGMNNLNLLMAQRVDNLARRFGRRLSIITVGFAGSHEHFSVLQSMAARPAQFGSNGRFIAARLNPQSLGAAFSTISSSLLDTRTELTELGSSYQRIVRNVIRKDIDTVGQDLRPNENWYTYFEDSWTKRFVYSHKNPRSEQNGFQPMPPHHNLACGVALTKEFFGEGAERIVREFREIGPKGTFIGEKLVAKESRFQIDVTNTDRKKIERFHRTFCDTQERAKNLAIVFNARLQKLPGYNPRTTPKVSFLDCSVYMVHDMKFGEIGMLVEKQLDPLKYKKWNDNRGGIDGQLPPKHEDACKGILDMALDTINDEDSEEEDDVDGFDCGELPICIEDIPQAFSHFTYRYTQRKLLVCDLQGVLSKIPPLFELTDPVIHFRSRHCRQNVFGRTDLGRKGIDTFFSTHKCSSLCSMLNKRWVRKFDDAQRSTHLDGLEEAVSNLNL